jgi:signal transduction histidine kinase
VTARGSSMRSAELETQNASLNEQVKLLLRTEKRLYQTRSNLELQLGRIRALNHFALGAMRTSSPVELLTEALDLLCPLFTVQAVVAVIYLEPGAEPGAEPRPVVDPAPLGLVRTIDGAVVQTDVPASLRTMPALGATNRSDLMPEDLTGEPIAPLAAWLDEVALPIEGDLRDYAGYLRRDCVLLCGGIAPGAAHAILAFRSASITHHTEVVDTSDLPFLEVICQYVSRSMEMTALYATLEQRVAERTIALQQSNEQLAESLERLQATQRQLVEASRRAGMSDVATSVLHNVGNVLNSVNVSSTLVEDRVAAFKAKRIRQVAELVGAHRDDLASFFTEDPRGKRLPDYLDQLTVAIDTDQAEVVSELGSLRRNVDHIKAIVALQQDFAKPSAGLAEPLSIAELIEDAARFDEISYQRHGVILERRFESAAPIVSDRHKLLQILTNLLSNARHAVVAQPPGRRSVTVRAATVGTDHVIEVQDTGCGIAPENLGRVFNLGFTTRADGHGFGLHASACSAAELGGKLTCHSDGVDRGALFRLTLPARPTRATGS